MSVLGCLFVGWMEGRFFGGRSGASEGFNCSAIVEDWRNQTSGRTAYERKNGRKKD